MARRYLTRQELEVLAENLSDIESIQDPFEDSRSEYIESEHKSDSDSDFEIIPKKKRIIKKKYKNKLLPKTHLLITIAIWRHLARQRMKANIGWNKVDENFVPRFSIPEERVCSILADLNRGSSELHIFMKLFPNSLFHYIAQCTNERLKILEETTKKKQILTDAHEIKIVIGCLLIMAYNKVPAMHHYWSSNKSLGNDAIKSAISRDRFQLLVSKLYFSSPKKPDKCSKLYYIEDVVNCLKKTFAEIRTESSHQSIDESMTKFKGRSTLKQYLPLKPIKRGIKIWQRCDAKSGYVYDFNIYSGKEAEVLDGTLGERVVRKLTDTVGEPNVSFCFDRFFTSVDLLDQLPFPAVGTCIASRKNMPKFEKRKRRKGEIESMHNDNGTIGFLWKDTKEVLVLSSCHRDVKIEVTRRSIDGSKINVECPEAIGFYNANMGGVDLSDQFTGLYDIDRKSLKWWKKVFYTLLLTSAVNAWIICRVA
ncbi:piggyBac transposable element-derived protein 4-like [Anoplophora glabripennis]|uniref:piggyBac transposable element-derived protein 4-like n=1 Tax=Anoplophora glabripennis TaxID=217634 RepID=UPI0008747405|nr:piggyBac transposable element-derived protein 4-like [Anoplophora glabripennis]